MNSPFDCGTDNDRPLHERIAFREPGALDDLIIWHSARVQIMIYRIIGDFGTIEDAEELANDVFLKVWQDIDNFDPSRGTFATWINMIAKYTALDFRRKAIRQWKIMSSFVESVIRECREELRVRAPATSLDGLEREVLLQSLGEVIRQLPEAKQELVVLRFGEGKTYAEIAKLIGKPVGSVKSSLHRLLGHLRQLILSEYAMPKSDST